MSLRNPVTLISVLSVVIVLSACSDISTKPTRDKTKGTSSLISKSSWTSVLPGTMSDEFCDSNSDLLQCYPISKDECHQDVKQITTNCVNSYSNEIPAHLGRTDATSWGGTIGNCTKNGILQLIQSKNLTATSEACRQSIEDM